MLFLTVGLIALTAGAVNCAENCACGWTSKYEEGQRIIGGVETERHEFPFAAALTYRSGGQFCGGTIITQRHVITAAHCTAGQSAENIIVNVGEHDWNTPDETTVTEKMEVEKIMDHEEYTKERFHNDISLLLLAKEISFSYHVGPACAPPKVFNIANQPILSIGWGSTNTAESVTTLQKVEMQALNKEECLRRWSIVWPEDSQVCLEKEGKGTYFGDSGGPNMWQDKATGDYYLATITSYGSSPTYTQVHTRFSFYLDWVEQKIKDSAPEAHMCRPPSADRLDLPQ